MHCAYRQALGLVLIWSLVAQNSAFGQDGPIEVSDNTAEIQAAIQSYLAAFHARDVPKLVAHWSAEGVYRDQASGDQIIGREAIGQQFKKIFEGDNAPKLAVATKSIDFVSPNVALERGTAAVSNEGEAVVERDYSAVYIKRDNKWLIDRVTEDEIVLEYSNHDRLSGLEWLIGEWADVVDGVTIELDCRWTRNQNFISRVYKVSNEDDVQSSGLQVIGWDPVKKEIRSWLFDSEGGFITGTWTERDEKWIVQSVATLADGGRGSYTSVFRPLEDGTYAWQKINRVLDGRLLPNIDETVVRRK